MQTWDSVLGAREWPRELSAFELEAFFTFSAAERELIEQRRRPAHKLGLALQMGFLRLSGRLLDAFRIVPGNLSRHLGAQLNIDAPGVASLRALYRRGNRIAYQSSAFIEECRSRLGKGNGHASSHWPRICARPILTPCAA